MTTADMLIDLRRLCPGIWARTLHEFSPIDTEGIWTGIDGAHVMPDDLPMFCSFANGCDGYNGPVHTGFEAWLAARGWWVENYDGATFFLLPEGSA